MTCRGWIGYAAGLVVAGAVGHALPRGEPGRAPAPALCAHVPGALDEAALRAAVRAELANLPRQTLPPAPAPAPPPAAEAARAPDPAAPPHPDAARALADGHQLIADALGRRRWSADDRAALRVLLTEVDRQDGAELLGELVPAINDGRLEVATGGGAPF